MGEVSQRYGFRRGFGTVDGPQRPPWTDEARVRQSCTSCGDCIAACPEGILVRGPANTPVLDFSTGECTFCNSCVTACKEDVFFDVGARPWDLIAQIKVL
ncbi:MAG: 4Fe-4S dicluster domain-containing protein [Paracoccaceae bacterium]